LIGKNRLKHQKLSTASKKHKVDTEKREVPLTSPRLERFRQKILVLQDDYHSAQKKVNQLSRELQVRTNKPEYQRRCREIRKELCDKIEDTVWKQKNYERENSKLQKMVARRTFTRIERAFGADASSNTPMDISMSYDQGAFTKGTVKLSTKEKICQLRTMLSELEDEVQEGRSSEIQWDDSDSNDEKKPAAVPITSAQAKLAKELIKLANTYKVPELTFTDKATKRRFNYQTWFTKLRPILAMFNDTACLIQGEKITPYKDTDCIGNKALFLLIGSRVDAYFNRAIRKFEGKGDQALLYIKNHCASTSADDTHHFHHLFISIRIKENESATNYFRRFTFARTEAEGVGNTYSEQSLVNFALAGLITSRNPKYDTAVQLFNLEHDSGKVYILEDIEKKFFAIDEKTGRETASARIAQGNVAMGQRGDRTYRNIRNPRRNGHRKTVDANAALDSNSSTRHVNTTCYYCGRKGHIMPNCPDKKSGKPRSNKSAQGNLAKDTGRAAEDGNSPELVCIARHVSLPMIRPPRTGPAPAVTMDFHARELGNTRIFVSIIVRTDESVFRWERERSIAGGRLPELYNGDLEPTEEPLWVLLHNRPLHDLEHCFGRIT